MHFKSPAPGAFTLLEVLAVLAVVGLLAGLLLAAASRAGAKASGTICLANLRQLQVAWQLYVDDFRGSVPPNRAQLVEGHWRSAPDSWIGLSNAPHDRDARPIQQGLWFAYGYNRALALYVCPADRSTARPLAGQPLNRRRTRSVSLNGNLGGRTAERQRTVERLAAVTDPARLFGFVDEAADSIDDAHFLVWPAPDRRWVNLPADRHAQTGVFSFVDGHGERWKWQHPKRFTPRPSYWKPAESPADREDLLRLQQHTLGGPVLAKEP